MSKNTEPIVFGTANASRCFGDACDAMTRVGGSATTRGQGKGSMGNLQGVHTQVVQAYGSGTSRDACAQYSGVVLMFVRNIQAWCTRFRLFTGAGSG